MQGLLDWAEKNPALVQGLLGGAFGAMAGRGTTLQALGQGGMAGLGAYANAKQDEQQNQWKGLQTQALQGQLEQQKAERDRLNQLRALPQKFMRTPEQQALTAGGGPTMANAQSAQQGQGGFDAEGYANALMGIDPMQAVQFRQSIKKDTTPIKLGQGESLYDPQTLKPLANNPKPVELPGAVREYEYARQQGYGGSFNDWELARRRAGASNTSLSVNTVKPLLNTMAEKLGGQVADNFDAAKSAVGTIETAQNVRKLLASGKVITGPGADVRMFGLQLGQTLGVGGANADETLRNTRNVMQGLAQSELDAAGQMKGQGQITESERSILKRAAAGEISFTAPELDALSRTLEQRARKRIQSHQQNVQRMGAMPDAKPLVPFYSVDAPPEIASPGGQPASGGGVRRYNPATGRIE